jgi:CBS domain-containing protein
MQAIEAARRPLHTVTVKATLEDVARLMAAEGLRAVVVERDGGDVAGIVTERDIVVRALARRQAPSTTVDEVMTPAPVTAEATGPLSTAYRLLREYGVRQIPLVEQGRVVGLLRMEDVADEMAAEILSDRPRCPQCDSDSLRPVINAAEETNFLCLQCRACWHLVSGELARVDQHGCPGCPDRHFCRFPVIGHGLATPPSASPN